MAERTTQELLALSRAAASQMRALSEEDLNAALHAMAEALWRHKEAILKANGLDLALAKGVVRESMLDRLLLNEARLLAMIEGIRALISQDVPFGALLDSYTHPNGLKITRVSVPLGVVGVIYESRPNVTSDAAALAIKSGNAVLLRSGKEAWHSAKAIVDAFREALAMTVIPQDAILLVEDKSRTSAEVMMKANHELDLLIPRGGRSLIASCVANATVPCSETGTGICHIYVDGEADLDKALRIVDNAKTSRPSVCNAAEVLLVEASVAPVFLPRLYQVLVSEREEKGLTAVALRCDALAYAALQGYEGVTEAGEDDFDCEFLDLILAVKVVSGVKEAIAHIAAHSTGHSEAIVTENPDTARTFTNQVDSAAVYVNASTRFTDGGEFGLGCEMGISTQKLHARGPFGLRALVSYKYVIQGNGQIR